MTRLQKLREHERLLAELESELKKARAIFQTKDLDDLDENYERKGAVAALMAVHNYLRKVGIAPLLRDPTRAVIGALGDADCGRHNRLFKVNKKSGRNAIENEIAACRGHAAAVVSLLVRRGEKSRAAAHKVASALDREGFQISGREDRDQTTALINFRKNLLSGRIKNEVARGVYDKVMDCEKYGPHAADRLLEELRAKVKKVSKPPTF